ncbi:hypothetical protein HYQ03_gp28 [Arthrobacter phage Kuleana]|uniref:Uncharacterized protein n=1 Tax=Arthrobacter phage Kuleana TaxID=2653270 RepID=A0A5Q2WDM3_9CAUD|nr:hypothetical protein HYQ03_gp28 [Arthrobacter phage Kuleana]QGH74515.1 hypothetical protein SEA_KULEANA_28 [Arthrobacter phage Kuleana]
MADSQAQADRTEKRRYRHWQHEDWNDDLRALLPPPEPEGWTIIRDWTGREIARRPEITGDLATYYTEPWRLL